jgi:hypothetical protein
MQSDLRLVSVCAASMNPSFVITSKRPASSNCARRKLECERQHISVGTSVEDVIQLDLCFFTINQTEVLV